MSIPKTERLNPHPRSKEERVAITLEYLSSFVVWSERLSDDELQLLDSKISGLVSDFNHDSLNRFLNDAATFLKHED